MLNLILVIMALICIPIVDGMIEESYREIIDWMWKYPFNTFYRKGKK